MKNLYANHFSETPGEYLRSYVNKEWRFLDALSEGIIVQNRLGEIILTNIAVQKILSINPQEIVGQTVFTGQLITIHEDGSSFTKETYPSSITLQTGKPQRGVIMGLQKKDDSICWIKVNAEPVLNKEESIVEAVVTSFTDITESVLANEKLKISERKLQTVLSSIKTGIFLIDTDYRLLLANAKGKKLLGITEDTLNENQHPYFIDLLPRNQYREKAIESFERMASGERVEYESKYITNDGKDLWLLVSCTGVKNETGVTTSFCIAATNITHQKKAEQRLAKSESRWKFALEGSGEGVWEYNFQTKESYYSPLYKKMLGFDEDEFKDEANEWLDKIFPNDLEKVDKIDRLYEEDLIDHHEVEYRIQNKSGEYVWILDRGMIVEKTATGAPLILVGTIKNINERKKTEDALKCSEKQFRSFMENTPTITWIVDENAHIKYLNPGYMKAFNLTEEVFGKSIYKIFPAGICNEYIANNNRVWETNQPLETIEEGIKPDGSKVVLQIFKFPLGTDTNGVRLLGGTALDITQLIKTQAELRISNDRYSYAGKASSDAIWDWDLTENRIYRGEGFKTIFGYETDTSSFDIQMDIIHPKDRERVKDSLDNALRSAADRWQMEYKFLSSDGTYRKVIDKAWILRDKDGIALRMIGAMQDVTEQRKLEKQLAKEQEHKKREIMKAIIDAQEKERQFISYELHDNVNQILSSSKLMLDAAGMNEEKAKEYIEHSKANIHRAIEEIRKISYNLNPATLQFVGLVSAISDMIAQINKTNALLITLSTNGILNRDFSNSDVELALFRITQEQLNNILRHARATEVTIDLTVTEKNIELTICDNGIGFDINSTKRGLGLNNMLNRAEFYHGKAIIESSPGNGCVLHVIFPVN